MPSSWTSMVQTSRNFDGLSEGPRALVSSKGPCINFPTKGLHSKRQSSFYLSIRSCLVIVDTYTGTDHNLCENAIQRELCSLACVFGFWHPNDVRRAFIGVDVHFLFVWIIIIIYRTFNFKLYGACLTWLKCRRRQNECFLQPLYNSTFSLRYYMSFTCRQTSRLALIPTAVSVIYWCCDWIYFSFFNRFIIEKAVLASLYGTHFTGSSCIY